MASVQIEATYVGSQPLVSVLEANLDFGEVVVTRHEYAIKAIHPLELLLTITTGFALNEFVLKPLIGPYAEKWKESVKRWLKPIQPFKLTMKITEFDLIFEAPLGTNHNITAEVWDLVQKTFEILKAESRLHEVARVRFEPDESGKLLILCYDESGPARIVDIDKSESIQILDKESLPLEHRGELLEKWQREVERQADTYRKYIEDMKQSDQE
jgi:hypothetical protein